MKSDLANLGSSLNIILNQSFAIQLLFPWRRLNPFLFCSGASSSFPVYFSTHKSYFIQPISFSSVTNIFCFPPIFFSIILLSIFYFSGIVPWVFYPDSLTTSSLYSECSGFTVFFGQNDQEQSTYFDTFNGGFFFYNISNPCNLFHWIDLLSRRGFLLINVVQRLKDVSFNCRLT